MSSEHNYRKTINDDNEFHFESKALQAAMIASDLTGVVTNLGKLFKICSIDSELFLVSVNKDNELKLLIDVEIGSSGNERCRMLNEAKREEILIQSWSEEPFSIFSKNGAIHVSPSSLRDESNLDLSVVIPFSIDLATKSFLEISYPESSEKSIRLSPNHIKFLELIFKFNNQSKSLINGKESKIRFDCLTPRQNKIAQLTATGMTNSEVSREMHISVSLIKLELSRIFRALQINNRLGILELVSDKNN